MTEFQLSLMEITDKEVINWLTENVGRSYVQGFFNSSGDGWNTTKKQLFGEPRANSIAFKQILTVSIKDETTALQFKLTFMDHVMEHYEYVNHVNFTNMVKDVFVIGKTPSEHVSDADPNSLDVVNSR